MKCFEDAYFLIRLQALHSQQLHVIELGMVSGVSEGPIESAV